MLEKNSYYSVVQFSARPSNFEYVNVGVVIVQPHARQMRVVMSEDAYPLKKLFDDQNFGSFKLMVKAFGKRLEYVFQASPSLPALEAFAQSRANLFRLLPFRPIMIDDLGLDAKRLFEDMVAVAPRRKPRARLSKRLANLFEEQGVLDLLEHKPEPVALPGLEQPFRADFGYQNGHYNLIDAVQIVPKQELSAVSRISGNAHLLRRFSDRRLIVVADLGLNRDGLWEMLSASLKDAEGQFFAFSDPHALLNDIRAQARLH